MALEDPFFVVRDEVRQSLNNAQQQYSQWCMLLESDVDLDRVHNLGSELKNLIKSIEWDLEDLDQTIKITENNPTKFRLNYGELETRKQFIRDTRSIVNKMKSYMVSDAAKTKLENLKRKQFKKPRGGGKYAKLEEEMERNNQDYIEQQKNSQQMIIQRQDQQIDQVGASVHTLKKIGEAIGDELDDQHIMLDEFDKEMEHTDSRLRSLTARVQTAVRKSGDKCQIITILVLVIVLVIVIVFFFIPF